MTDRVILIVEDDPVVGMAIKLRLEKLGYKVADITNSGEEAVQKAPILQPVSSKSRPISHLCN